VPSLYARKPTKPDTGSVEARVTNGRYQWLGTKDPWRTCYYGARKNQERRTAVEKENGNAERMKVVKTELRIGTLNVGTKTGKGREIVDMMVRRKVDVLCVQETRWKGERARTIGDGFKIWYCGYEKINGVVAKKDLVDRVVEVERVFDRIMAIKIEKDGIIC
jgi:hypothetical protein